MSTYKSVMTNKAYRSFNNQMFANSLDNRLIATRIPPFASGRKLRRKAYIVALEFTPLQQANGTIEKVLNRWSFTRRFVYARNRQFLQNASKVIAGTREAADSLHNDYNVSQAKIVTVSA